VLLGDAGDDYLVGGGGFDTLSGEFGDDTIDGALSDGTLDGGSDFPADFDTITYAGAAGAVTLDLFLGRATVAGEAHIDVLSNFEHVIGSGFDDWLKGGVLMEAGAGNDHLEGATTMTGGSGTDVFAFRPVYGSDSYLPFAWITDFSSAQGDRIDLSSLDANAALAGRQSYTFIGNTVFNESNDNTGLLRIDQIAGWLQGSTDADEEPEWVIALTGITTLTAADLIL
jgi:Ca2+-binding RTX toxin-like protein